MLITARAHGATGHSTTSRQAWSALLAPHHGTTPSCMVLYFALNPDDNDLHTMVPHLLWAKPGTHRRRAWHEMAVLPAPCEQAASQHQALQG